MVRSPETGLRRFYKHASTQAIEAGGFSIVVDGKAVRTPSGHALRLPTRPLADEIAKEWNAQGERIAPDTLPFTKLANTAIDAVQHRLQGVIDEIVAYGSSDLICYRADRPEGLVQLQSAMWDPVLEWLRVHHGMAFRKTTGIQHIVQPPTSLAKLRTHLQDAGPFKLAAFHVMTSIMGSALLSLALCEDVLNLTQAWSAARVDEEWQASVWGEDFEAKQRTERRFADFEHAFQFYHLI